MDFSKVVAHEATHATPAIKTQRFNSLDEVYAVMRPALLTKPKKQRDDIYQFFMDNEHRIFSYVAETHGFLDDDNTDPADLMALVMKHTRVSIPKYYLPAEEPEPGVVE